MNPTPASNTNDNDETAFSAHAQKPVSGPSEATDVAGPTDVTVVRATPSAPDHQRDAATEQLRQVRVARRDSRAAGWASCTAPGSTGLDRTVALKMILGTGSDHETAVRFLQEARAAAALDHPNVVPIYDIGEIGDRPYFTMALIDGPNLRGHVDALGTRPDPDRRWRCSRRSSRASRTRTSTASFTATSSRRTC